MYTQVRIELKNVGDEYYVDVGKRKTNSVVQGSAQDLKPGGTVYPYPKFQGVNCFLRGLHDTLLRSFLRVKGGSRSK